MREAIAIAIDRPKLVEKGMSGRATPLHQVVPPGVVGYSQELGEMPHDLERARKLLAEAGKASGVGNGSGGTGGGTGIGIESTPWHPVSPARSRRS